MNNYSDTPFTSIDPLRFLELKRAEILFILKEELGYSGEKACAKFDFMVEMIKNLRPIRACKSQTISYVEERVRCIPLKVKPFTINFLLKAIISEKRTWKHAYNSLAHLANRNAVIPIPYDNTPEHEMLTLIEHEMPIIEKNDSENINHPKISLQQIALLYVWEGKLITKENSDQLAREFGYKSGAKLYQKYTRWSKRTNRVADPDGSTAEIKHKIELFESVIELLPMACKAKAREELQILKGILDTKYLN